jgi:hypothetical protein
MADRSYRTADPYRDTDVIDARGPRANQLVVGLVSLIGVASACGGCSHWSRCSWRWA